MRGSRIYDLIAEMSNPCPVCGRQPKIYRSSMNGENCTFECKPFLRKPHLKVESAKADWKRALVEACNEWNRRTKDE